MEPLILVQAWTRAAVPAVLETTPKFAEEAEPLTQVQIHVQKVSLQQIDTSWRRGCPVWIADIFATFPKPYTKREMVTVVLAAKREKLQAVQRSGPTSRIAEISIVFVIRHVRKGRGWARASRKRLLLFLRRSGDTREKHQ
jgi:hypothetical protein